MERGVDSPLWYAAVGALSGGRTMAAPVLVCDRLREAALADARPARGLASRGVAFAVHSAAVVEMVVDKLPITGDRTAPAGILARTVAGSLAGAVLSSTHRRGWLTGTLLGGAGAIAGTFATFHLRRALRGGMGSRSLSPEETGALAGLLEDAILIGLRRVVRRNV